MYIGYLVEKGGVADRMAEQGVYVGDQLAEVVKIAAPIVTNAAVTNAAVTNATGNPLLGQAAGVAGCHWRGASLASVL